VDGSFRNCGVELDPWEIEIDLEMAQLSCNTLQINEKELWVNVSPIT